ncbi:MAG TPA: hypothetical protein PKG54_06800 [Phycisphaerae bacterium]|jgi:flagellar basal body-associated protein FliL|nr:hypothetical protein [Phycisphaerae bacterium]HOJ55005.1 hypothetical protein [Phycisphaerae bacterium]HOL26974.1 hypothetical protein [Phycisphaerae bacterium]HPP21403.1 hypothetical protein [Phycisphaerae bacterium]HPU33282.1 hypothetical protein [Phycisphaerae bacterium]
MADEKKAEAAVEQSSGKSSKKKTLAMGGVLLGIMAAEALVVVFVVKHFTGGPATAEAAPSHGIVATEGEKKPREVEVEVVRLRAQNERSQRHITYDLVVFASVLDTNKEKVEEVLQRRKNTIQDRLSRIVRAAEPERFSEPDLRSLRKLFEAELGQLVGDEGLIQEVLIPTITSSEY